MKQCFWTWYRHKYVEYKYLRDTDWYNCKLTENNILIVINENNCKIWLERSKQLLFYIIDDLLQLIGLHIKMLFITECTVYRHGADLSLFYPLIWIITLEYTTNYLNVCPNRDSLSQLSTTMLSWWHLVRSSVESTVPLATCASNIHSTLISLYHFVIIVIVYLYYYILVITPEGKTSKDWWCT